MVAYVGASFIVELSNVGRTANELTIQPQRPEMIQIQVKSAVEIRKYVEEKDQ